MEVPSLKMSSGREIPQIGFGLWRNTDEKECVESVKLALKAGYRHFDDAQVYDNEEFLGEALNKSDVARSDIFVPPKLASKTLAIIAHQKVSKPRWKSYRWSM